MSNRCYACGQQGHFQMNCPFRNSSNQLNPSSNQSNEMLTLIQTMMQTLMSSLQNKNTSKEQTRKDKSKGALDDKIEDLQNLVKQLLSAKKDDDSKSKKKTQNSYFCGQPHNRPVMRSSPFFEMRVPRRASKKDFLKCESSDELSKKNAARP